VVLDLLKKKIQNQTNLVKKVAVNVNLVFGLPTIVGSFILS